MSITSETDEMTMLKNDADSSSLDDITSEGNMGENCHLKKGPWTSVEDAILVEYVTKNGEGNWNAVQKHSGLARCGKSCRLRWANHLRPDLKKGAFTPQEERHIIELHAKMGNKWARMAAELPGRTDNEIKNYWNTRIKRRQRAGLPIYPPDLCSQPSKDNQPTDDMNDFPINNVEIPNFEIKNLELNQQLYPPPMSSFLDIPTTTLLSQSLHPPYTNRCFTSRAHPSKRFRGLESSFTGLNTHNGHISEPFMLSFEYDNNSNSNHVSSSSVLFSGSHADLNGNLSSSEPGWAMKLELPSFQNQTGHWGWSPSSPLPSLESVDTFQTPPTENVRSCNLSSRNSGLLDAVLYESKTLRNPNNSSGQKISSRDPHETECDADGDSLSPLGHSTSAFNEGTPISKNSVAKSQSVKHATGWKDQEESRLVPVHHHSDSEASNHMIFYRPDLVLGSDYFAPMTIPFSKMQ